MPLEELARKEKSNNYLVHHSSNNLVCLGSSNNDLKGFNIKEGEEE